MKDTQIQVEDIQVHVVRKRIKNLYLGVYPPYGKVRVTAPFSVSADTIRLTVVGKLGWIRRRQARLNAQPRQSRLEIVNGETHYLWGQQYRLDVIEADKPPEIRIQENDILVLQVRPDTPLRKRVEILDDWYRSKLRPEAQNHIAKWEQVVGVHVAEWGIKKMKTRWGTCNIRARRIWLNLELAKKPIQCLEHIIVHELTHLLERRHNKRFKEFMNKFLPDWKLRRAELNRTLLTNEQCNSKGL